MKRTMKRIAVLMLALCFVCLAVFTGCAKDKKASAAANLTKEYFEKNTTEVLRNGVDLSAIFGSENPFAAMMTNGKNVGVEIAFDPGIIMSVGTLEIRGIDNSDSGKFEVGIEYSPLKDETLDLGIYFDSGMLSVASKALTGSDKAYGIKFESIDKIAEKFDSSSIAKILGLEEGSAKAFFEENGITDEYIKGVAQAYKEYSEKQQSYTLDKMYDELMSSYEPYYGEITEEKLDINGTQTDVLTLSLNVNEQLLEAGIVSIKDICLESVEAQNAFYESLIPESLKEEYLPILTQAYEEQFSVFDEITEAIGACSGTINVSVSKETGLIVKTHSDVEMTFDGETMKVKLDEYISDDITYTGTVTADDETTEFSARLYKEETQTGIKCVLEITSEGPWDEEAQTVEIGIVTDRNEKTYKLYFEESDWETQVSFRGTYDYSDTFFSFTVDSMWENEVEEGPLGLSIKYDTQAIVQEPSETVELFELSEDEVYELVGRIASKVQNISSRFEAAAEPEFEYSDEDEYAPLSYDDYEQYADYYTYEEFCEFVDMYNSMFAE